MRVATMFMIAVLLMPACAARMERSAAMPRGDGPADGIEFDLARPCEEVFHRALIAFVQGGVAIEEASASSGVIRTGSHQLNAETVTQYTARIVRSGNVTRLTLRGTFSAPTLGISSQAIAPALHGLRAEPWKHLSQLAHAIDAQSLSTRVPETHRKTP